MYDDNAEPVRRLGIDIAPVHPLTGPPLVSAVTMLPLPPPQVSAPADEPARK